MKLAGNDAWHRGAALLLAGACMLFFMAQGAAAAPTQMDMAAHGKTGVPPPPPGQAGGSVGIVAPPPGGPGGVDDVIDETRKWTSEAKKMRAKKGKASTSRVHAADAEASASAAAESAADAQRAADAAAKSAADAKRGDGH